MGINTLGMGAVAANISDVLKELKEEKLLREEQSQRTALANREFGLKERSLANEEAYQGGMMDLKKEEERQRRYEHEDEQYWKGKYYETDVLKMTETERSNRAGEARDRAQLGISGMNAETGRRSQLWKEADDVYSNAFDALDKGNPVGASNYLLQFSKSDNPFIKEVAPGVIMGTDDKGNNLVFMDANKKEFTLNPKVAPEYLEGLRNKGKKGKEGGASLKQSDLDRKYKAIVDNLVKAFNAKKSANYDKTVSQKDIDKHIRAIADTERAYREDSARLARGDENLVIYEIIDKIEGNEKERTTRNPAGMGKVQQGTGFGMGEETASAAPWERYRPR